MIPSTLILPVASTSKHSLKRGYVSNSVALHFAADARRRLGLLVEPDGAEMFVTGWWMCYEEKGIAQGARLKAGLVQISLVS